VKKGFRIFKRKLKKIKKLIISEEYLKLIEYILFLIQKNIEILVDRNGKNTIILEKTPCKRGEVFIADFGFGIGSEFRYKHYCVVISVNKNTAVVIPFTSKSKKGINLGIIQKLQSQRNSKQTETYALVYSIRSISRARLFSPRIDGKRRYIKLSRNQMDLLDNEVKKYCGNDLQIKAHSGKLKIKSHVAMDKGAILKF